MAVQKPPQDRQVVFRLQPLNDPAWKVVLHKDNKRFLDQNNRGSFLNIGSIPSSAHDGVTLVNLGRQGDIRIDDEYVDGEQCSFEWAPEPGVVMLYDKSHNLSTQVFSLASVRQPFDGPGDEDNEFQFEPERVRKVLVGHGINRVLGMCGPGSKRILFRIVWPKNDPTASTASTASTAKAIGHNRAMSRSEAARFARKLDDTESTPETTRITRMHSPALGPSLVIRYHKLALLGGGVFGVVHRVVNVDTGTIMALKEMKPMSNSVLVNWDVCKREVENLAKVDNVCPVPLLLPELDMCPHPSFPLSTLSVTCIHLLVCNLASANTCIHGAALRPQGHLVAELGKASAGDVFLSGQRIASGSFGQPGLHQKHKQ